jgi:hypothetical protein
MTWRPHRKSPEDTLHIAVARFLNLALPAGTFWTTIPTGNLSRFQAQRMKAKGYRPGTPDIVIIFNYQAYWLELKAKDGVVSDEQRAAHFALHAAGAHVGIARSLSNVQLWLQEWGIPLRATLEPASVRAARLG